MLHVGRDKIYHLLRTGQLRSIKIGKLRRITEQQLAEFIASSKTQRDPGQHDSTRQPPGYDQAWSRLGPARWMASRPTSSGQERGADAPWPQRRDRVAARPAPLRASHRRRHCRGGR
jgi:excisionase family DNA binding protein